MSLTLTVLLLPHVKNGKKIYSILQFIIEIALTWPFNGLPDGIQSSNYYCISISPIFSSSAITDAKIVAISMRMKLKSHYIQGIFSRFYCQAVLTIQSVPWTRIETWWEDGLLVGSRMPDLPQVVQE
jgi:hypothetical protein